MNTRIAQFQILMLTAPALMALLLVPSLTLDHPLLVSQNTVPSAVRSAAVPGRIASAHQDASLNATSVSGNSSFAVASPVAAAFGGAFGAWPMRYSVLLALSQPCRAP